jgi:bifunctional DNA-binding transcriptional regulator/antitoxin component of YhaV-PrlF toxin-antitoxin module
MADGEVGRATTSLYTNGVSEHVTVPKPLRGLLKWRKREDLVITIVDDHTISVTSFERHMRNAILADRRERADAERAAAS